MALTSAGIIGLFLQDYSHSNETSATEALKNAVGLYDKLELSEQQEERLDKIVYALSIKSFLELEKISLQTRRSRIEKLAKDMHYLLGLGLLLALMEIASYFVIILFVSRQDFFGFLLFIGGVIFLVMYINAQIEKKEKQNQ